MRRRPTIVFKANTKTTLTEFYDYYSNRNCQNSSITNVFILTIAFGQRERGVKSLNFVLRLTLSYHRPKSFAILMPLSFPGQDKKIVSFHTQAAPVAINPVFYARRRWHFPPLDYTLEWDKCISANKWSPKRNIVSNQWRWYLKPRN